MSRLLLHVPGPPASWALIRLAGATPVTLETVADRRLWLDARQGVAATGAAAFVKASNQCLTAPPDPALRPGTLGFWAAGWFRLAAHTTGIQACFGQYRIGTSNRSWILDYNPNTTRFRFNISPDGAAFVFVNSAGAPSLNTWYFLFGWHVPGDGIYLSVDGAAPTYAAFAAAPHQNGVDDVAIGRRSGDTAADLDGAADSVAFGKQPSPANYAAIRDALYNGGLGVRYADLSPTQKTQFGLSAWWDLDEASGTRFDAHGPYHMTPVNNPLSTVGAVASAAADGEPAWRWTDRIDGLVLAEPAIGRRPTYRSTGDLECDGVDDRLTRPGAQIGDRAAFTLLARIRVAALPATDPAIVFEEADAAGSVVLRLAINPAGFVVASYRPSGGTLASATSSATVDAEDDVVIGLRRDGTDLRVLVAGLPDGAPAAIDAGTDLAGATLSIAGPVAASGFAHLAGDVLQVFAVGSALSDAAIAALAAELAQL